MNFIGTGDSDKIVGTNEDDTFDMSQGGHDTVKGCAGNDTFLFGDQFFATDHIEGGSGVDTLVLEGPYQEQTRLHGNTMTGIEILRLVGAHSYSLKLADGNVAAGKVLTVQADVFNGNSVSIDGRNETDGRFHMIGSVESDGLFGGARADTLDGGKGHDVLAGGGGADIITGGEGIDHISGGAGADWFIYLSTADSRPGVADIISDLDNRDHIDLSAIDADVNTDGDQAFVLTEAFTHHAGEAVLSYDPVYKLTSLSLDTDGDGHADGLITMTGDHTDFTGFVL